MRLCNGSTLKQCHCPLKKHCTHESSSPSGIFGFVCPHGLNTGQEPMAPRPQARLSQDLLLLPKNRTRDVWLVFVPKDSLSKSDFLIQETYGWPRFGFCTCHQAALNLHAVPPWGSHSPLRSFQAFKCLVVPRHYDGSVTPTSSHPCSSPLLSSAEASEIISIPNQWFDLSDMACEI